MADSMEGPEKAMPRKYEVDSVREALERHLREFQALIGSDAFVQWVSSTEHLNGRFQKGDDLRSAIKAHEEAYGPATTQLVLKHQLTRLEGVIAQAEKDALNSGGPF